MAILLRAPLEQCVSSQRTTPTAGVTKGDLVSFQDTDGFAFTTADSSKENEEEFTLIVKAPKVLVDLATGETASEITQGDVLYVDSSHNATNNSTGNTLALIALESPASTATTILCSFDGTMAYLKA